ncbi:hypothetical protein [Oceaniglobus roseus]|uniref:hypothetical protein n=1 Tax=Oceaniglobus roseus TaxID=1737570 RepID=UPI000C7EBF74|nr:hypothetical protein [Kandeliimicrobium roseum]
MKRFLFPSLALGLIVLTGCAQMKAPGFLRPGGGAEAPLDATTTPQPGSAELPSEVSEVVTAPPPSAAARTAEDFDTTTAEQRAKAAAAPEAGEKRLGETVASLGDPTKSGFWIKTPLVSAPGSGRLEYPATGKSTKVELIPLDGPATGGSQVSLAALRNLDAPITDLPTLVVYAD